MGGSLLNMFKYASSLAWQLILPASIAVLIDDNEIGTRTIDCNFPRPFQQSYQFGQLQAALLRTSITAE